MVLISMIDDATSRVLARFYPAGTVVIELRLDGVLAIRFGSRHLKYREVQVGCSPGGSAPRPPEFNALAADASEEEGPAPGKGAEPTGIPPTGGRSGRTPAEPYPPTGTTEDSPKRRRGPAEDHPWRKPFNKQK